MEGDSGVGHNTMLSDALQLHYERPSLLLVEGGRRKQGTPWIPLTPTYRKPALFLCYIVLLKTKQSLAQCVRNNRAQCVRHHPLGHSVRGVILLGTVCEAQYSSGTTSCDRTVKLGRDDGEIYCSAVKDTLIQTKYNQLSEAFIGNEKK